VIFPLQRLIELESDKVIGKVAETHYSFSYVNDPSTHAEAERGARCSGHPAPLDIG
jgi:hypothetical protein